MNEGTEERLRLERHAFFWPIIIFPYYKRSHTATIIGWKDHRPRVLKDVKASFAGKVWFTDKHLRARSFLLRTLLSINIPFDSIESVKLNDQDRGLIEISYRQAEISRLLRFLTKGASTGIILYKLDDEADKWLQALAERLR